MATSTKTEQEIWKDNQNELSALIENLGKKMVEKDILNPKIAFILNWGRGRGAYSLRLSKKRQI